MLIKTCTQASSAVWQLTKALQNRLNRLCVSCEGAIEKSAIPQSFKIEMVQSKLACRSVDKILSSFSIVMFFLQQPDKV